MSERLVNMRRMRLGEIVSAHLESKCVGALVNLVPLERNNNKSISGGRVAGPRVM